MATLKQKKADPNSKYWRDRADEIWRDDIREVGECEICGIKGSPRQSDGKLVVDLEAHHVIKKGPPVWREKFRHDRTNGICICTKHHSKWQKDIGPHGSEDAQFEWWKWVKRERSGVFQWYEEHKDDKRKPELTYRQSYELLKG